MKRNSYLLIFIISFLLSACGEEESSKSSPTSTSSKIYISGSLTDSDTSSQRSISDVKYIAAISTTKAGDIQLDKIESDGSFNFPINNKGDYIFKLINEYGLANAELSFTSSDQSVFSVQQSTDFGEIDINDGTTVIVNELTGSD
jgi:hypothetical protein